MEAGRDPSRRTVWRHSCSTRWEVAYARSATRAGEALRGNLPQNPQKDWPTADVIHRQPLAILEVLLDPLRHLCDEGPIVHQHVELVRTGHTDRIDVEAPNGAPIVVDDRDLGVHHPSSDIQRS